jgi:hypothetical protein
MVRIRGSFSAGLDLEDSGEGSRIIPRTGKNSKNYGMLSMDYKAKSQHPRRSPLSNGSLRESFKPPQAL